MTKFAYERGDGGVSIFYPAPKEQLEAVHGPMTDEQYTARVKAGVEKIAARRGAKEVVELPDDWTPPDDRTFRRAWVLKKGRTTVDMAKARDIHMDRIRSARNRKLDDLDRSHARASGQRKQAEADAIEAKRQSLRDVPQTVDASLKAAKTPAELKALWPKDLD